VASRKVGNAVARNTAKRWLRALFRRNKKEIRGSLDLILIAKPGITEADWPILRHDYLKAVRFADRRSCPE
jgi:ribonuclease P protein component